MEKSQLAAIIAEKQQELLKSQGNLKTEEERSYDLLRHLEDLRREHARGEEKVLGTNQLKGTQLFTSGAPLYPPPEAITPAHSCLA